MPFNVFRIIVKNEPQTPIDPKSRFFQILYTCVFIQTELTATNAKKRIKNYLRASGTPREAFMGPFVRSFAEYILEASVIPESLYGAVQGACKTQAVAMAMQRTLQDYVNAFGNARSI